MESDDDIFLMKNTFSQEPFSPELNLEELVGDFREVSERDSVEVEKKQNPGRNIVVVCDNEVEKRRESRIPANMKVNTSWAVRCWEEWAVERNVKVKKNSSKEKYYEVNPDIKKVANEQLDYWLGKFVLEIRKKKEPGSIWFLGPSVVNGYYAARQNRIVFLAAILQPPFYNPRAPSYLNYGGIGMVIGHEITHGFDSTGRLFDKDGNINNWFSHLTTLGYIQRQNCLAKQYSEFEVYGRKINGTLTINENIADNGGIKLAFEAYKTSVKNEGTEGALPGVGLTEDQLFFIGFARPWCSLYKKKAAYVQLETDNHSFPKYRIIGTLHNYEKFSEAFNCKPGSPMNPVKKCSLW